MDPHLQGAMFRDDVDFYGVVCSGTAVYMVGAPDGAGALSTSVNTYPYWSDYGTNGMVYGNDGEVEVEVPIGVGDDGCLIVMETWMPRSGASQDVWQPVGNHNGLPKANYIGCGDYFYPSSDADGNLSLDAQNGYCCFDYNKYATIKMSYDTTITAPAESLIVVRWDTYDNEWCADGIYYLYGDMGFDTGNHEVQFSTDCLYGIYAVARILQDDDPGTIHMEYVGSYPECEGYVGPYSNHDAPKFLFKVWDHFAGIDDESWVISLNGTYIYMDDDEADYWDIDYDYVTGYLGIWIDYDCCDESWPWNESWPIMPPLECGDNQLYVGVYNEQHNYASMTVDFEVDCDPPVVVFENSYVSKDPTIEFYVSDAGSGVDWENIFVDVIAVQQDNTNPEDPSQNEHLFFLGTFFPHSVEDYKVNDTTVRITTSYNLQNTRAIFVAIYDGTRDWYWNDYYYYSEDPIAYDDWDEFYVPWHGVGDCAGNMTHPYFQELTVDLHGPMVLAEGEDETTELGYLPTTCSNIMIRDNGSGVDETSIEVYEDGELVEPGDETYSYDPNTGIMMYCPTAGADVMIIVYDAAGNQTIREWTASGAGGIVDRGEAINYPNPFDPREDGFTTIDSKFDGDGEVTITIYDFAGSEVASGTARSDGTWNWNGYSSDGEMVANGVYFAYCKASDGKHKVVKIAVIKR
jgi:hypothetical protein